jgi:hypothetical protein
LATVLALAGYVAQGVLRYWAGIGSAGLLLVVLVLALLDMRALRRHFRQERAKLFRRTLEGREEESGGMVP